MTFYSKHLPGEKQENVRVIEEIKLGVDVAFSNKCFGAAVILIYAGIDTMAYLNMPSQQKYVKSKDFIAWVERYIRFPCKEQLTGADLYGARCAMLHQYGIESKLSHSGSCRIVGYIDRSDPEVSYNPKISKEFVIVSIEALKDAFFAGIHKFLHEAFDDESKRIIVEERLNKAVQRLPYKSH
jgi:hypothetical protein